MVFSKYKKEDKQLTGVSTLLTKLTAVAPVNKVAINVCKLSVKVPDILFVDWKKTLKFCTKFCYNRLL